MVGIPFWICIIAEHSDSNTHNKLLNSAKLLHKLLWGFQGLFHL